MQVEIKLDLAALGRVEQAARDAALETMGALRTEVVAAQVMPFDQGTMQNQRTAVAQEETEGEVHTMLVTDTAYARRLFNHPEYDFQTVNNPNAGGEWLKPWMPGGINANFVRDTYVGRLKVRMPK